MRTLLRKYEQYVNEVKCGARRITGDAGAGTVIPVQITFWFHVEFLKSSLDPGFIPGSYSTVTENRFRDVLEDITVQSKQIITFSNLGKIVEAKLRTNMNNKDAVLMMQDWLAK